MFENFISILTRIAVALEAIAAGGGLAASAAPAAADTSAKANGKGKGGSATTTKAGPTAEETNAALAELKDYVDSKEEKKGITYARKVMQEAAGVQKMAEIPEDKRAAVIKAAAKELEAYKAAEDANDDM